MKLEWRKNEKNFYLPKVQPELINIPKQKFIMIQGKGNPNDPDFSERVGVLYSIAYSIKMMPRSGFTPEGYFDYTVYPLEGLWDLTEEGRASEKLDKDKLLYTIMIRQPDFVNDEVFNRAVETVKKKKPHAFLEEVTFNDIEDGLSVQAMHLGPYDDEYITFNKMKDFIRKNNLEILTLVHREIYVRACKGTPSSEDLKKLKTVLRYRVKEIK